MDYKLERFNEDVFVPLEPIIKNPSKSSTGSNYKLSSFEIKRVLDLYNGIPESTKWVLSTGKVVEEEMKKLAEKSIYEHPVHSLILETDDLVWKDYFSVKELEEIKKYRLKPLPSLPEEIEEYLNKYNRVWKSGEELYNFADSQKHNPITEFDYKWIRESIVRASELFLYEDILSLNNYSESDLLHDVWPFVYRIFKDRNITATLGENSSVAVALGRNAERSLENVDRRSRKAMGARVDILFKICKKELGSCEVGLDDVTVVDDKYLDDGLVKLPKTLRDMFSVLAERNMSQINNLKTIGFLMIGLSMELVVMDCPVGHNIVRVTRTPKLEFPTTISTIALDLLPLLEATWKAKEVMKNTVNVQKKRKRKVVELNPIINNEEEKLSRLPYSFVRSSLD